MYIMTNSTNTNYLPKNIFVIDAEYIDRVAFNLTVNFERMLGRRIPKADLANWLDYIALDSGLQPEEDQSFLVIFIHEKNFTAFDNFEPSSLKEINGMSFKDNLGEFTIESYVVEINITNKQNHFIDTLDLLANDNRVENIMLIADTETYGSVIPNSLNKCDKNITTFCMEPIIGHKHKQEILGYSLTCALGVRSEEFK
jgi:hypothetical protein